MTYPFLPVNPCCTEVVINDPCGCNSTLTNGGCGQNPCGTNVTISSNVLYNGPTLDCIIAEPCDTLNVILQKIDEIICNLLTQINLLNVQVNNITEQIINIESNIININNTLNVCCNVTTTTTTTNTIVCTEYDWQSVGENTSSLEYTNCLGEFTVIPVIDVTDNSGVICVQNGTIPVWNPIPSGGTHLLATYSISCN